MPSSSPAAERPWATWALGLACVATFMLMMDVTVMNIAMPAVRRDLSADLTDQQWILNSYTLPLAAFLLTGGNLGDQLGRRKVFLAGLALFTISSLAAGLTSQIPILELARAAQGVGAAVLFAISPALIAQEFSVQTRAKAYGVFGAVTGLSLAVGPIVGGLLTSVNWRWIFLINVPIGIVLMISAFRGARDIPQEGPRRLDVTGLISSTLALVAITFGIVRSEVVGWSSPQTWGPIFVGIVLFAWFIKIEREGEGRMLDTSLLNNRSFGGLLTATFLSNATSLAGLFLVVSYVQNVLGHSPIEGGLILLPLTLTLFLTAAFTGNIMDRFHPGRLLATAIGMIAVGLALFSLARMGDSWLWLLPGLITMGVGMGMFNPPRSVLTVSVVAPEKAGLASGIGETFQQVGVVFGIAVFGALFQTRVVAASPDAATGRLVADGDLGAVPSNLVTSAATWFTNGFSIVMLACGAVCAVGAAIALLNIRYDIIKEK